MSIVETLVNLILNSQMMQGILGLLGALIALFIGATVQKNKGRKEALQEEAQRDAKNAQAIVDRVRDVNNDGVPLDEDERGYRD